MSNLFLTEPTLDLKVEYLDFYQEWLDSGGAPDSDYIIEDGTVIKRFWISLD